MQAKLIVGSVGFELLNLALIAYQVSTMIRPDLLPEEARQPSKFAIIVLYTSELLIRVPPRRTHHMHMRAPVRAHTCAGMRAARISARAMDSVECGMACHGAAGCE